MNPTVQIEVLLDVPATAVQRTVNRKLDEFTRNEFTVTDIQYIPRHSTVKDSLTGEIKPIQTYDVFIQWLYLDKYASASSKPRY
jgi:hypothetical protein